MGKAGGSANGRWSDNWIGHYMGLPVGGHVVHSHATIVTTSSAARTIFGQDRLARRSRTADGIWANPLAHIHCPFDSEPISRQIDRSEPHRAPWYRLDISDVHP